MIDESWMFEQKSSENITGIFQLSFWYTEEEIAEYDFRFETKYLDCRQETAAKNQNPIF